MSRVMKHSGIEWIGEIPKEWKTISFSNGILRMSTGLNPRDNFELSKDDEYYYVTIKNFKDGKIYLDDNCDRISKQAWGIIQERSQLEKGDILFASISKDGQAYILEEPPVNWNINESVFSIRTNHDYFADKYFYYHIIDSEYYNDLRLDATGTTFQSIKQNKLRKSILCLPPLHEQQKIADYLDKVCGEVDDMIALQEQMIEELKAYKQSVITDAVTKGLNHNVPMKDSGIDWIGEVPEHWKIKKIGFIFNNLDYLREPISAELRERNNPQYNYYGASGVIDKIDHYNVEDKVLLIGEDGANLVMRNLPLIYKAEGRFWVNNHAHILKPIKDDYNYMAHTLEAADYRNYITGFAQPKLSQENLKAVKLPVPPLFEQQSIASYLDDKCAEIDAMIALKQSKIEELKEYKKSVIYEYVTGKKEIA